jgi:GLPGLI family protein
MRTILVIYAIIISLECFSQSGYKITYDFIPYQKSVHTQSHILLHNNSKSYFFKEDLLDYKIEINRKFEFKDNGKVTSIKNDTIYKSSKVDSLERIKALKYKNLIGSGNTVRKNFIDNTMYFTGWSIYFKDSSFVKDTLNNFNWKLIDDTSKLILNKVCKMAKLNWRGRDFIAWYCPDISIFDGPYKFCGLPGLILDIYDTEKEFEYLCKAIVKEDKQLDLFQIKNYVEFDTYSRRLRNGIVKVQEIMDARNSINSDCTTCKEVSRSAYSLSPGIELSLYEGL